MSKKEQKIIDNLTVLGISVDTDTLKEYSSSERDKLERLSERMVYLFNKVKTHSYKAQFAKDEFRALEWVFYELGIIADGVKKIEF